MIIRCDQSDTCLKTCSDCRAVLSLKWGPMFTTTTLNADMRVGHHHRVSLKWKQIQRNRSREKVNYTGGTRPRVRERRFPSIKNSCSKGTGGQIIFIHSVPTESVSVENVNLGIYNACTNRKLRCPWQRQYGHEHSLSAAQLCVIVNKSKGGRDTMHQELNLAPHSVTGAPSTTSKPPPPIPVYLAPSHIGRKVIIVSVSQSACNMPHFKLFVA